MKKKESKESKEFKKSKESNILEIKEKVEKTEEAKETRKVDETKKLEENNRFFKRHKKMLIFLFILVIILPIFGGRIYLYLHYFLGNDTLVTLEVNKEDFEIKRGENATVEFEAKVRTNPFCKETCDYSFSDLSTNKTIEKSQTGISQADSLKKSYTLFPPELGEGIKAYKFEIQCKAQRTTLCETTELVSLRSSLITLKYSLSEDEEKIRTEMQEKLNNYSLKIQNIKNKKESYQKAEKELNEEYFDWKKIEESNENLQQLKEIWKADDYYTLSRSYDEQETNKIIQNFEKYETTLLKNIEKYNEMVLKINYEKLYPEFIKTDFDNSNLEQKEKIIENIDLITNESINEKEKNIIENYKNICDLTNNCIDYKETQNISICEEIITQNSLIETLNLTQNITKIEPCIYLKLSNSAPIILQTFNFSETISCNLNPKKCCIYNECKACGSEKYIPLIFVHGHAFDKELSAEYSLDGFASMQNKFEEEGYLNAGIITLYTAKESRKILSELNHPLSFRTSYYLDTINENSEYIPIQVKSENIDTYAIRLRDIVSVVKEKTNSEKVNIVAFSMGSLVTRRYMQVFGTESVNKVILIGAPNKGVNGTVSEYCALRGSQSECADMDSKSLFINKLNRDKPNINLTNIYGIGCDMEGVTGDGVVVGENSKLDWANNIIINGTCRLKSIPLHIDLIDPNIYPNIYKNISETIKI